MTMAIQHPDPPRTLLQFLNGPPKRTQRWLAQKVGITQSMVSHLLKGDRRPGSDVLDRLHKITGVPYPALLKPRRRGPRRGGGK